MQKIIVLLLISFIAAGCTAYKMEVQQGNVVTQTELDRLEIGMDRRQVQFLLGTPLLQNPFDEARWDYYYTLEQDGDLIDRYSVTLFFDGDRLERIERQGDLPADEQAVLDTVAGDNR